MMDKTWQAFNALLETISKELREFFEHPVPSQKNRRHRITSKDGHIVVTGDYKTLTVNGKKWNGE